MWQALVKAQIGGGISGDAHTHLSIGCTTSNASDERVHYKLCWLKEKQLLCFYFRERLAYVAKKKLTIGQLK
jgi:hypothetical protein